MSSAPLTNPDPVAGTLVRLACAAVAALAVVAFPMALWFQSTPGTEPLPWPLIAAATIGAAALCVAARGLGARVTGDLLRHLDRAWPGVATAIAVGLLLRLLVVVFLAPQPSSDGATYIALAEQLARTRTHGTAGSLAYWPPGMPLALVPWIAAGLPPSAAVAVVGMLGFVITALGLWRLGRALEIGRVAVLPVWLIAVWPTLVLASALPEKELLVAALMPWIMERTVAALRGSLGAASVAGALLGLAVLTQPSLQLLPVGIALVGVLTTPRWPRAVLAAATILVTMLAVVAPWTVRNQLALGTPVLVSTNGGDVLYRANNELASGAYRPKGAVDLSHLDEVARDRESKRLAFEWIVANPARFAQLTATRALLFLGDDSYGAYAVFQRGRVDIDRTAYLALKLAAAVPWVVVWVLMLGWLMRPGPVRWHPQAWPVAMVALPIAYLLAIHSVFESGGKYHIPVVPIVLVLLALAVRDAGQATEGRREERAQPAPRP